MCSAVPTTQKASQRYYCGFQHFFTLSPVITQVQLNCLTIQPLSKLPFLQRTVTAATLTVLCILIRSSWTNRKGLFRTNTMSTVTQKLLLQTTGVYFPGQGLTLRIDDTKRYRTVTSAGKRMESTD